MGLLYQFPTKVDVLDDRIMIDHDSVVLKSYGLPMIFWGYLAGILFMLMIMYLAIRAPLEKIMDGTDQFNKIIALAVIVLFITIPLILLILLFYEKNIIKTKSNCTILHKVFWVPISRKKFEIEKLVIENMEGTPNVAKMENRLELKGFQNRGYFNLFAIDQNNRKIFIDRSNQKKSLEQILELLS